MAQKPSIPKGTRDFSPLEVAKRKFIMNTIQSQFEHYGFQPIETPSFENSSTLMGKYGEEGDRLIFKILESGDYLKNLRNVKSSTVEVIDRFNRLFDSLVKLDPYHFDEQILETALQNFFPEDADLRNKISTLLTKDKEFLSFQEHFDDNDDNLTWFKYYASLRLGNIMQLNVKDFTPRISEKALRYDLTVPFARYVVQHQNDIEFPFKRYQMQPVWRADRPQKGRFREFYQCDADVVGSDSLWQEVELVQLYDAVFMKLGLEGVTIKMNNRKILSGIAEVIGASDKLIDFTVALDKLDKIGEDKVKQEMLDKGISQDAIDRASILFSLSGNFGSQLTALKELLAPSQIGMEGIEEMLFINEAIETLGLSSASLQLDVTLARGLNYYTGAIFEVAAPEGVQMGSIGGGGRYADLTGIFGLKDVSGVGISFGLDRIYLVLEELGLFPEEATKGVQVLFINFGQKEALYAMQAIKALRAQGIAAELYPDMAKMKKQMTHANRRAIPFVILAGDQEVADNTYTLKDMVAGTQNTVTLEELTKKLV